MRALPANQSVHQIFEGRWRQNLDFLASGADVPSHPRHPFDLLLRSECRSHTMQRSRQVPVVAVEIGPNIAGDARQPLVDRMRLAAVGFADPVAEVALMPPNDVDGTVGAASVD